MHSVIHTEKDHNTPHIIIKDLSFGYTPTDTVLENINLSIKRGEYLGIVGGNGSGKTTLIKILLGLIVPTSGSVQIVNDTKLSIGYVPQHISMAISHFPATVAEIVKTGRIAQRGIFKIYTEADSHAVTHAVTTVGITHLLDRRISELSGGERQRVFIARALATEPSILILDEPDSGIDHVSHEAFYTFLKKLHTQLGLTILLISHDIDTVVREADTVMCLNKKMICYEKADTFIREEYLEQLRGTKKHHPHCQTHHTYA